MKPWKYFAVLIISATTCGDLTIGCASEQKRVREEARIEARAKELAAEIVQQIGEANTKLTDKELDEQRINPPVTIKTIKLKDSRPSSDDAACTTTYSAEYPQLSGTSNKRFLEDVNKEIENLAKGSADGGTSVEVRFNVLQNDGAVFAVQLKYSEWICGANFDFLSDTVLAYDIENSKKMKSPFTNKGNRLYSSSAVTMSVQEINRIISEYDGGQILQCCYDSFSNISKLSKRTFVIADGNVAVEVLMEEICDSFRACGVGGTCVIPLYKWDGIMR